MRRVTATALLLVSTLVVSSCAIIGGGGTYDVVAYFPRAVSLYESGSVQVLGLPAGEVSDIEVVGDRVKVTMAISDDIPVPTGVKAAIVPQSLIGERRIQLFPPYQEGDPAVTDGYEIAIEDTIVPIEPDEALAALKEFLDSLDPDGLGRLIDNGATALDGQGENIGTALDELSDLVSNIESNDDDIISIAERFDDFTATLLTREAQLGQALDDFAVVADVLADERADIELLVRSLADLSGDGLDLVSEHAVRLRRDIEILTRLARSIDVNLASVQDALDGSAGVSAGFLDSYNEDLRAFDLRNSFAPLLQEALSPIFDSAGIPFPCVPVDVVCPEDGALPLDADRAPVEATLARPRTPIDDILELLGTPGADVGDEVVAASPPRRYSGLAELVGTFLGVGS